MQIFPAIDLRGGQVVRLYQGDYDQETVYAADPCAVARGFLAAGARYLHVVDLDGARDGTLANFETIAALVRQGGLYIEVGGGIRTEERIRRYLDLGVSRCILGTIAVKDFAFTERMARTYGERIAVGVDAREGFVAVSGWKELSAERGVDFCRRLGCRGEDRHLHRYLPGRGGTGYQPGPLPGAGGNRGAGDHRLRRYQQYRGAAGAADHRYQGRHFGQGSLHRPSGPQGRH